jgi:hypothetical protein
MAQQLRFRCTMCDFTTPWIKDEGEEDALVEDIRYHTTTEHPGEVDRIQAMRPGVAKARAIKKLEKLESRRSWF